MSSTSAAGALPLTTTRRALYVPAGWPLYALFLGFPLWWVLGLSAFILPIMAIPMAAWLLRQRTILGPKGFATWIAFLLWMLGSATQIDDPDKFITFGYAASLYVGATILLLYIFNISRETLATDRVINIMVIFWIYVVIWGILGVLFPTVSFTTPVEGILPQRFTSNEFFYSLVHPSLAQVQGFLGYDQPRPSAPFPYATNWAAAFGLLTPFAILGWRHARTSARKSLIAVTFVVGVVPAVSSLGRGLWLSLSAGLVYAAVRSALAGKSRTLLTVLMLMATASVIIYVTPLQTLISDRFAHPHSNASRLNLYEEATERVAESPWLGFGSPQPAEFNPNAPPVGTQGQLWQVLVSHGIVGAVFFFGWFLYQFWRLRKARTDLDLWFHTMILIALIQAPFYDSLGIPLAVIMIGIALAGRAARNGPPPPLTDVARA